MAAWVCTKGRVDEGEENGKNVFTSLYGFKMEGQEKLNAQSGNMGNSVFYRYEYI